MILISAFIVSLIALSQASSDLTDSKDVKCEKQMLNFIEAASKDAIAQGDLKKLLEPFGEKFKNEGKMSRDEYLRYVELTSDSVKEILTNRFDFMDIDGNNELDEKDMNRLRYLSVYFDLLNTGLDTNKDFTISEDELRKLITYNYPQYQLELEELFAKLDRDGNRRLDIDDYKFYC